ncbi:MAG TPA: radical SAM family heme chaperone HemW [Nitrospira sp.]|nr:radical SAM family heme chaperone HemW [Nitrospira sp.]
MNHRLGLYIHIPFCRQRCDFCAFYLEVYREAPAARFVTALKKEIDLYAAQAGWKTRTVQSVYFGGGTPTVLGSDRLTDVLAHVRHAFPLSQDCEITVEAHPATVSCPDLHRLAEAGVTRMSFGAESMQDDELLLMGRPGLTSETVAAVSHAREAGFHNINLDLMYGLPGQSVSSWSNTIERCLELNPAHVSCYALTVEGGTKLARDIAQGRSPVPDEERQVTMDEAAHDLLRSNGYERYEISNYARPGYACRHNLLYWTGGEYLGLGPSAQSFVNGERFGNAVNLTVYHAALDENRLPLTEQAALSHGERLRDAVVFGLRLVDGISADHLHEHAMNSGRTAAVEELEQQGLIEKGKAKVKLTAKGRRYADLVAERLY